MAVSVLGHSSSVGTSAGTSKSFNVTVNTGSNLLLVRVALRGTSSIPSNISVSYAGNGLTFVSGSLASNASSRAVTAFFALMNPATASSLSLSTSWTNSANYIISASSISGAGQFPINGGAAYGNSTSPSVSAGTAVTGGLIFDTAAANSGRTLTPAGGGTAQYSQLETTSGASDLVNRGATKVTAPSATMSYTLDTSTNWVISVCTVEPVTAGANFFAFF